LEFEVRAEPFTVSLLLVIAGTSFQLETRNLKPETLARQTLDFGLWTLDVGPWTFADLGLASLTSDSTRAIFNRIVEYSALRVGGCRAGDGSDSQESCDHSWSRQQIHSNKKTC